MVPALQNCGVVEISRERITLSQEAEMRLGSAVDDFRSDILEAAFREARRGGGWVLSEEHIDSAVDASKSRGRAGFVPAAAVAIGSVLLGTALPQAIGGVASKWDGTLVFLIGISGAIIGTWGLIKSHGFSAS